MISWWWWHEWKVLFELYLTIGFLYVLQDEKETLRDFFSFLLFFISSRQPFGDDQLPPLGQTVYLFEHCFSFGVERVSFFLSGVNLHLKKDLEKKIVFFSPWS